MANEQVGVTITAKDETAGAFGSAARAAEGLGKGLKSLALNFEGVDHATRSTVKHLSHLGAGLTAATVAFVSASEAEGDFAAKGAKATASVVEAIPVIGSLGHVINSLSDQIEKNTQKELAEQDALAKTNAERNKAINLILKEMNNEMSANEIQAMALEQIKKEAEVEKRFAEQRKHNAEERKRLAKEAADAQIQHQTRVMAAENELISGGQKIYEMNAQNRVELEQRTTEYLMKEEEKRKEIAMVALHAGEAIGESIGRALAQGADVGKAASTAIIESVERIIMASAAEAAAKAFAAHQMIPFVGFAIGSAAAAAAFAFVKAYMGKVGKAEEGGEVVHAANGYEVSGGLAGHDSVRAMLMPGERVLTVRENYALKTLAGSLVRNRAIMSGGGAAYGGEAVGMPQPNVPHGMTIVAKIDNPEEMTDAQLKRWALRLNRHLEDLVASNSILRNLARA